jgi:hypothetical protein
MFNPRCAGLLLWVHRGEGIFRNPDSLVRRGALVATFGLHGLNEP